jgi:hypothetical protein
MRTEATAKTMTDSVLMIPEPTLEFRYAQGLSHPRDGLAMFGPYDQDAPSHPASISYGVVGTQTGIKGFQEFSRRFCSPILDENKDLDKRLWPIFPGFEAAFGAKWPAQATRQAVMDDERLHTAAFDRDPNKRAGQVVDTYLEGIQRVCKGDETIHVIVCVVPDFVYDNCRPKSRVTEAVGYSISARERERRSAGQRVMFNLYDPAHYLYSVDFRRQIKARAMKFQVPIQIVLESTLRLVDTGDISERGLTPLSDRAWNLGVTIYYKAGGKPWRLATARDGVCYIGLAYRLTGKKQGSRSACCAAQMFLDTGDGVVFMGQEGTWYSPQQREFHLSRDAAKSLLTGVLKSYEELGGKDLKEIFLHSRSSIDAEEFLGFSAACPKAVKLIGIRVRRERRDGVRAFREGTRPLLRGTFWKTGPQSGFLWSSGFKPRLATYDGWETPVPLRIDVQQGEGDIEQVARDIFGLTKLNYNACRLGESEPVTVGFSSEVGEILVSNPTVKEISPKFKFYI